MSDESTWGIGDQLRGLVNLKEVSWRRGWGIQVDIRSHPIEGYLCPEPSILVDRQRQEDVDFVVFDSFLAIDRYLSNSFDGHDKISLSTNGGGRWPRRVSPEAKSFARKLLQPCDELVRKLGAFVDAEYTIIHFRLGDQEMSAGRSDGFERELALLKMYMRPTDVLLTDSHAFKMRAHNELGIRVTPTVPVHVGVSGASEAYLDTLFEFFLVTRAKSITTYSVYPWISGFVLAASKIYDVSLKRIEISSSLKLFQKLKNMLATMRDYVVLNLFLRFERGCQLGYGE